MKDQAQKFGRFLRGKSDVEILEKQNTVLNCKPVTPAEAVYACGKLLLESGCIEGSFVICTAYNLAYRRIPSPDKENVRSRMSPNRFL